MSPNPPYWVMRKTCDRMCGTVLHVVSSFDDIVGSYRGTCRFVASFQGEARLKVKVAQPYPTLCDPMDCTVHDILQARILEWAAFPSPGGLPNPGTESRSPALQADPLPAEPQGKPLETQFPLLGTIKSLILFNQKNIFF